MFKKLSLFVCLAAFLMIYSVTANAFGFITETASTAELEQTPQKNTPEAKAEYTEAIIKAVDTVFELKEIPFETVIVETDDLPAGERVIFNEGCYGEMLVIKRMTIIGDIALEELSSEKIVKEPVAEIVHLGTSENIIKTEEGYLKYKEMLKMSATAYCLCKKCTGKVPGQKGYGITASGMPAAYGVVAVDPKVIPLGTKLYIEGYGVSIAGDTGSGVKGYSVDLFYDDKAFTEQFGRQSRTVYILAD